MTQGMNQMVGSSSTSLAEILQRPINISVPVVQLVDLNDQPVQGIDVEEITVMISFTMEIKDLIVTQIMQIVPLKVAKEMLEQLMQEITEHETVQEPASEIPSSDLIASIGEPQAKVSEPQYQSFANGNTQQPQQQKSVSRSDNMDLILEVPVEVTVELGSCKKSIKEILGMSVGSIVVLNKLAGEMVEIKANGKLFAVGEVVVIEDSYGVRLTEIIKNK